jgi:hypothetical protein
MIPIPFGMNLDELYHFLYSCDHFHMLEQDILPVFFSVGLIPWPADLWQTMRSHSTSRRGLKDNVLRSCDLEVVG